MVTMILHLKQQRSALHKENFLYYEGKFQKITLTHFL